MQATREFSLRELGLAFVCCGALSACGGGGTDVQELPITNSATVVDYAGPPPATDDVQAFKLNLWDNLKAENRCGGCHVAGAQSPMFVRQDDVNLAYGAANGIVDLGSPADSRIVAKVGGGHNCWLGSDDACADIMTTWVSAWAGEAGSGGEREIDLKAPSIKEVGESKNFPVDSSLFASTVHPLLTTYCSGCHNEGAVTPQSPYIASTEPDAAYDAAKSKIDLDDPSNSRLVLRLGSEFHNCWSDCQSNAGEMLAAITGLSDQISATAVDPTLVTSKAMTMFDGVVASGGNRYEANVIAAYEFKTGQGTVAYDTSGVEPALNLTLSGDVSWVGGWGINVRSGKAQGSTAASKKIHDLAKATGEYAIETWVVPGNVSQEDARIVSYSGGTTARNFTLGQTLYNYDHYNRSGVTDGNGEPALSTPDADEVLQATQQHVVVNYDPINGREIFVNGVRIEVVDQEGGSTLADWDDTFAFVLGNEVSSDRQWQGVLRYVGIHNRALTPEQIAQNFEAGVGEKFFVLFSVSDLLGLPDSYIMFEVSQFDSYSYLFTAPAFISLDSTVQPDGIPIRGMRIGVNGAESEVGQAYRLLDVMIDQDDYTAAGQPLSEIGTIIGLEKGPAADEFFLTFDVLGNNSNVRTEPVPLQTAPSFGEAVADIGIRTFGEINATMAAVTGVSPNDPLVKETYQVIIQQLPTVENIGGFLSAHQVAVAQLAIEYCNALVDDGALRSDYFPGFDIGVGAAQAFDTPAERDQIIDPLLDAVMGTNLASQPDPASVKGELDDLIGRLSACGAGCAPTRTATIAKATCAAVLGSAVMLVQ